MVSVFFADTVNAKAQHTSTTTSIIFSEPLRRSRDYANVIRVQYAPHRTTNVIHSRAVQRLGGAGMLQIRPRFGRERHENSSYRGHN